LEDVMSKRVFLLSIKESCQIVFSAVFLG